MSLVSAGSISLDSTFNVGFASSFSFVKNKFISSLSKLFYNVKKKSGNRLIPLKRTEAQQKRRPAIQQGRSPALHESGQPWTRWSCLARLSGEP